MSYSGYEGWPSSSRWAVFNTTLGGSLLRGIPPAAAYYEDEFQDAAKCNDARRGQNNATFGTIPGGPKLFPRSNFENPKSTSFRATMDSIRAFVEDGGYNFHSVDFAPTYETAGYPGTSSAVNPALRNAVMHATGYDNTQYTPDLLYEEWKASHAQQNLQLSRSGVTRVLEVVRT
ncbi:hypothetical protein EK21DRAFT_116094 [Setomelanomma holmii]|uniref:Uncharacterized protein n=1 Tax=Setomelanomma holmii TaxID=210430 RepID=A0A9P4H2S3_9PLEO|nr:hypothetical protein EK21DRAFT_116094 [Setomelanomma holmii]